MENGVLMDEMGDFDLVAWSEWQNRHRRSFSWDKGQWVCKNCTKPVGGEVEHSHGDGCPYCTKPVGGGVEHDH